MKQKAFLIFFIFFTFGKVNGGCPNIITKRMWGGQLNADVDFLILPVNYTIIAHTVSQTCNTVSKCADIVKNMQDYHIASRNYHDISYNFLIGGDGNVYEGVGWNRVGAHTFRWNVKSIGIAFIGDFSDQLPPPESIQAAKQLLQCGVEQGNLSPHYKVLGHRQVSATLSPGTRLYMDIVNWPHWEPNP